MWWFLGGIALLLGGYMTYGRVVEKIIGPDDRQTPAKLHPDGVDYVVLPNWKNMLIQLLNIAGVGPVIGVILGVMFGEIVFILIPLGNIFGGAVHDFTAGMMSLRKNGANLPKLVEDSLGKTTAKIFGIFVTVLLLLVVAVFVNVPAGLIALMKPGSSLFWPAVLIIFAYYICATLFPVDKIIGKIYPIFGALLLIGSIALFVSLVYHVWNRPELLTETKIFKVGMYHQPIVPVLFVTIACGILSGFHATQSPIIARTMATERDGRANFYGMMIVEGIIAMIWAAGAMAIYNLFPSFMGPNANATLIKITTYFLGSWMGGVTTVAVIILAVTSGDTALRSLRLSLAETFSLSQISLRNRFLLTLPLIVLVSILLWWSNSDAKSFKWLWNYFAWGNQVLAATTLMAGTVWLLRRGKKIGSLITLLPGMFMTAVVVSFIVWTSGKNGQPAGLFFFMRNGGLPYETAIVIGIIAAVAFAVFVIRQGKKPDPLIDYTPSAERYADMEYRHCGKTGLQLPRVSLGLWQNFGGKDNFDSAHAMVWTAFDRGITHFDLANNYGPPAGSAEEAFGHILKADFTGKLRDEQIGRASCRERVYSGV